MYIKDKADCLKRSIKIEYIELTGKLNIMKDSSKDRKLVIIEESKKNVEKIKKDELSKIANFRDEHFNSKINPIVFLYRLIINIKISKINKKIYEFEKYLENKEKELLKNSDKKATLVLEDKK